MKVSISYNGSLASLGQQIQSRVNEAIGAGAETVRANTVSICPVDTGTLQSSITISQNGSRAEISANTDYAAYVEYGTSKMKAQPYLVPSLLGNENAIISAIAEAITE